MHYSADFDLSWYFLPVVQKARQLGVPINVRDENNRTVLLSYVKDRAIRHVVDYLIAQGAQE